MPTRRAVSPEDELQVLRDIEDRIIVALGHVYPETSYGVNRALDVVRTRIANLVTELAFALDSPQLYFEDDGRITLEDGSPPPPLGPGTYRVIRRNPVIFTLSE